MSEAIPDAEREFFDLHSLARLLLAHEPLPSAILAKGLVWVAEGSESLRWCAISQQDQMGQNTQKPYNTGDLLQRMRTDGPPSLLFRCRQGRSGGFDIWRTRFRRVRYSSTRIQRMRDHEPITERCPVRQSSGPAGVATKRSSSVGWCGVSCRGLPEVLQHMATAHVLEGGDAVVAGSSDSAINSERGVIAIGVQQDSVALAHSDWCYLSRLNCRGQQVFLSREPDMPIGHGVPSPKRTRRHSL